MLYFFRLAFKHDNKFSQKMLQRIIFNLVPLVEKEISREMKEAGMGAIMHDGWSKFGTHYVGLFAQYNRRICQNIGKTQQTTEIPTNVLLSMRPMSAAPEQADEDKEINDGPPELEEINDEDEDDNEDEVEQEEDNLATSFTAEVHANYFTEVLEAYGVELKEWAVCQVGFQI